MTALANTIADKLLLKCLFPVPSFITVTLQHPFIHSVIEVAHIREPKIVVMIQTAVPEGSLKDILYKARMARGEVSS